MEVEIITFSCKLIFCDQKSGYKIGGGGGGGDEPEDDI